MCARSLRLPVALSLLGVLLFLSWFLPAGHGIWQPIDEAVFFFFQQQLAASPAFALFVGVTNVRAFDAVAFLVMLGLFFHHYRRASRKGRRLMLAMGLTMLVAVFFAKQFDIAMSFERPSPTIFFAQQGVPVLRVHELTGLPAKDGSAVSFPGDHTMMLMIFAGFMARYFGTRTRAAVLAVLVLFSLPRLMSGSHWLTDDVVGAGSNCLIVLSWMLLTPLSDCLIHWGAKKLPPRLGG